MSEQQVMSAPDPEMSPAENLPGQPEPVPRQVDLGSPEESASGLPEVAAGNANIVVPPEQPKPAKPSGLKLPSKIGRLCALSAPKLAVPVSPRNGDGGSTDSLRKFSDDYTRKHLADLVEADEETEVGGTATSDRSGRFDRKTSTSSTYSLLSMDALWEKHPRRLSEAGLRRSSDHSIVLTEDTDSFIIGDHVWVGGNKPGQIAYIGETQFAPGEWAGIVLDDPIGKNDGSVAGTRYFQCPERRGVFSRLTRLTRIPLFPPATSPGSDSGSVLDKPPVPSPNNGTSTGAKASTAASRARRSISPVGSVRSNASRMNSSVYSSAPSGELKLGDRVIVSSSQGSKAGVLRYKGPADFAAGTWCGVELDDPIGKNDGSVEGRRYFECAPRFGLFAPASKVSKSPSNRKPGSCAIHCGTNGRSSSLRRSGSRDSLTSLGTSIVSSVRTTASRATGVRLGLASLAGGAQRTSGPRAASTPVSAKNTLQELLREKQQHLERMMKERELERSEMAKITLQADRAETALALVRKESAQAQSDNDKLKTQLEGLLQQLEDEKQKVEDLQFQAEEENINKEDFNKYKQNVEEEMVAKVRKISELEAEVSLLTATREAARTSTSAAIEKHTAETETLMTQHREELQAAQSELQKLLDEAYALLREKENEKESIGKSMNEDLTKMRLENEKLVNEAKSKLSIAQTEFEAQLAVLSAKLQAADNNLTLEKQSTEKLSKDNAQATEKFQATLAQLQAELQDKTHEFNKVVGTAKEYELSSSNDIMKLKMELSAKIHDLESLTEGSKKTESTLKIVQDELIAVRESSSQKIAEYEVLLNETSQKNDTLSVEVAEMRQQLLAKNNELERAFSDTKNCNMQSEKIVEEYKQRLSERDKEIVKLKNDLEIANKGFEENQVTLLEEHNKEINEKNLKIEQLSNVIEEHKKDIEKNKHEFDGLMAKVRSNLDELEALTEQNNKLKASLEDSSKVNAQLSERISCMELESGDLKRQLQNKVEKYAELKQLKEKLEADILNLTSHSSDSSVQLNKLTQNIQEKENELQVLRDAHRDRINDYERVEQELKQQLDKVKQESIVEKANIMQQLTGAQQDAKQHQEKILQLNSQITQAHEASAKNMNELQNSLEAERENVAIQVESFKALEIRLQTQMQTVQGEADKTINELKSRIELMKENGLSSEVTLKEKVDQLVEAQNDLNNKLEIARNNEEHLQKSIMEVTTKLNSEKLELDAQLKQKEIQLTELKEVVDLNVSQISQLTSSTEEKDTFTKDLTLKYAMLEVDLQAKTDVLLEKERQIGVFDQEITRLLEQNQNLELKMKSALSENTNLQQRIDNFIQDKSGNDSMLKEHQRQLESFRKTLETAVEDKNKLDITLKEKNEELIKLNSEHSTLLAQVEEVNKQVTDLKETLKSKEEFLNAENAKVKENKEIIEKYTNLVSKNTEEIQVKDKLIIDFTQEIETLKNTSTVVSKESSEKIENLKTEMDNIKTSYKTECETLKTQLHELQNTNKELVKTVTELSEAKEKVTELQTLLTKSEADIKQLNSINDGQKSNYEDLNQQLKLEFEKYKKESKTKRHGLMERLQKSEKLLGEAKTSADADVIKQKEQLAASEKSIVELSNKVELLTLNQENSKSEQVDLLEKVTLELQAARKAQGETSAANQELLIKLNLETENRNNEIFKHKEVIAQLNQDIINLKAKVEIAEREKVLLQKEKSSWTSNGNAGNNNNITNIKDGENDKLKLLEEKEIVLGQVDFLNSVIVDMQRKNEQLVARVQALETGFLPQEVEEFNFNGVKSGKPAPRLFCDICDVFDAHDTEDCPRQAATDPPPPLHARKPPPAPRPYCDVCEVFGHTTENCVEEETY